MKKITLILSIVFLGNTFAQNSVTVETSQAWNAYVNTFNVSDGQYAFGFAYGVADNQATATTTSVTLEPNIKLWDLEAANPAWFDNSSGSQVPVLTLESLTYVEDPTLTSDALTFSGNVSSYDLDINYNVIAFIKVLAADYSPLTVESVDLDATGDFSVSVTAAETAAGAIVQYGFAMYGLPADPADTTLGSVVIGAQAPPPSGNSVTVETSQAWNAYVNTFNVSDGQYAFGFAYGVADNQATATTTSVTLEPNIKLWDLEAANPAWFDNSSGSQVPVLTLESLTYVEDPTLTSDALTFSGNVSSYDLDINYNVIAFIKVLAADYSPLTVESVDLDATGDFSVSVTAAETAAGAIVQYGFAMYGLPADPADTTLGSVVIGNPPASGLEDNVLNAVKMFPNPAKDTVQFSVNSNENLDIQIFDMLGKAVLRVDNVRNAVYVSELNSGLYFVQMTLGTQKATKKLVIK